MNLCIFLALLFLGYMLFSYPNTWTKGGLTEGMTDSSSKNEKSDVDGIAGNADTYAATIKSETIKMQDMLLISKYRTQYETVILNLDDYVNNLMLKLTLNVDQKKPQTTLFQLAELNNVKGALNNVLKFVDKSS
jgi:hypothetical protein